VDTKVLRLAHTSIGKGQADNHEDMIFSGWIGLASFFGGKGVSSKLYMPSVYMNLVSVMNVPS
jgi:hypothetical protein